MCCRRRSCFGGLESSLLHHNLYMLAATLLECTRLCMRSCAARWQFARRTRARDRRRPVTHATAATAKKVPEKLACEKASPTGLEFSTRPSEWRLCVRSGFTTDGRADLFAAATQSAVSICGIELRFKNSSAMSPATLSLHASTLC